MYFARGGRGGVRAGRRLPPAPALGEDDLRLVTVRGVAPSSARAVLNARALAQPL